MYRISVDLLLKDLGFGIIPDQGRGSARSARTQFVSRVWAGFSFLWHLAVQFQNLTVDWNLNVLEMALEIFYVVQGLSPRYISPLYYRKYVVERKNNWKSDNLEIPKTRFSKRDPEGGRFFAYSQ